MAARGLIAAVGTDAENVYAVLSARVLRPDLYIVGRTESEEMGAEQMVQTALRPAVVDFVQLGTGSDNPEPAAFIRAGDKLVVLARPDFLKRLELEAAP